MITRLEKEAAEEADAKAFCDKETSESKAKQAELTATSDKSQVRIEKATATIAELKEQIKALQEQMAEMDAAQAEATSLRNKEHEEYLKASKEYKDSAEAVAKITGDSIENHEYSGAWWSSDVIIHNLTDRGYLVDYQYNEGIDFDDPNIVGYIIHIPKKFHFITVRRSSRTEHSVEVVDSMAGIETMRKRRLTLNAKQNEWNVICVKKTTDVDPVV